MRSSKPTLCYITDRHALAPGSLAPLIRAALHAGIDLVQIREKDLATRELLHLVETALADARAVSARALMSRVVVNDRLDVALAAGADGVHLGGQSMPLSKVRTAAPFTPETDFWVGVSCHSVEDVRAAEAAGADYVLLGPIFETASKLRYGPPLGLETLREAALRSRIPLLALGGITPELVRPCLEAGATGIAGISTFQECAAVAERVKELLTAMGL